MNSRNRGISDIVFPDIFEKCSKYLFTHRFRRVKIDGISARAKIGGVNSYKGKTVSNYSPVRQEALFIRQMSQSGRYPAGLVRLPHQTVRKNKLRLVISAGNLRHTLSVFFRKVMVR